MAVGTVLYDSIVIINRQAFKYKNTFKCAFALATLHNKRTLFKTIEQLIIFVQHRAKPLFIWELNKIQYINKCSWRLVKNY